MIITALFAMFFTFYLQKILLAYLGYFFEQRHFYKWQQTLTELGAGVTER